MPPIATNPAHDKVLVLSVVTKLLIVKMPVIVQSTDNVLVFVPENDTGPGNVLPPELIVLAADIAIPPLPPATVHEWAVLSVKFPARVNVSAVLMVTVEV
jgi:hypothetical protein